MATTFGTDFAGFDDVDPNWTFETNELRVLAYAVARRFITPRGGLFYDDSYGYDLRNLIADTVDEATAQQMIEAEATKDERVTDCQATITASGTNAWTVSIACTADDGQPFYFTLSVSAVSVSLITVGP